MGYNYKIVYKRLSEIIEYLVDNRGKNPPYYTEDGIPVIDTYLIGDTIYPDINSVQRYIDDNLYDNFIRCKTRKNDLLVTLVGNGYGNSCLCNDKQIIIQNAVGLRFNDSVYSIYAYYYFKQKGVKYWIQNLDRGSAQPNVKVSDLLRMKLSLPDHNNQVKISQLLNNYDSLIENNNKRIKLLETMAEELYKEWLAKYINTIKVKTLNDLLVNSFNGGWGKDDVEGKYVNEGHVIRGTDIPDILNSDYSNIPYRYHSDNDIKSKQLKENDIIIEISNGNINNIGRALLISKHILNKFANVMSASFCKTLRFNNECDAISTFLIINYLQGSGKMMFYKNTGTNGINNFNFKRFLRQKIYILDQNLLSEIKSIFDELDLIRHKNEILIKQREYLLPRLVSGKLSVENKNIV